MNTVVNIDNLKNAPMFILSNLFNFLYYPPSFQRLQISKFIIALTQTVFSERVLFISTTSMVFRFTRKKIIL